MFVSYISYYLATVINMANIALAVFYFPTIVDWLESIHWDYIHRSMDVPYIQTLCDPAKFSHVTMPKSSILIAKADLFEKRSADHYNLNAVNYNVTKDEHQEEIQREAQKIRQNALFDQIMVKRQNYKAWATERMVVRPKGNSSAAKPTLRRRR